MTQYLRRIVESALFQNLVVGAILVSAILVGIENQPWVGEGLQPWLRAAEWVVLGFFTIEIALRIASHGRRPWRYFQHGWNVFDFIVVVVCFVPDAQFAAVLRILRILRLLRWVNRAYEAEIFRLKHEELAHAHDALIQEQERSERLLLNVLPVGVANRLKQGETLIADSHAEASVLFADLVGFTAFSAHISPEVLVTCLDDIFCRFDSLAERHGLEKIKTIGDAYMVVAGLPEPRADHARVIAEMALDMKEALEAFNREHNRQMQARIGIHSGPVVAGVIGQKKFIYDLWGDTVNTASRMESHGLPGRIQITAETLALLGDGYRAERRGMIPVKGKGEIETFLLLGRAQSA